MFKDRSGNIVYLNSQHIVKLAPFYGGQKFGECTIVYHDITYLCEDGSYEMFTTEIAEPAANVWKKIFGSKNELQ